MAFHRGDPLRVHFRALSGDAEGPVPAIAPGPPGDPADLLRMQPARAPPVELSEAGEGDVVEVMFSPIPIASVATRKSTSPDWNSSTWALRVRGDSEPITTAAPPRWRRISSAIA